MTSQADHIPMLNEDAIRRIDRELAKFPPDQKRSAVMSALRIAQEAHGWLSPEVIQAVAAYLDMPDIAVQEVATFYSMFDTRPVGKHKITVCTNLSCNLAGAEGAATYLKKQLGIEFGETTEDGLFTLSEGECMGACGEAPVMLVGHQRMCCSTTPERIDALLAELKS